MDQPQRRVVLPFQLVSSVEAGARLDDDLRGHREGHRAAAIDVVIEDGTDAQAVDVLHGDVIGLLVFIDVEDLHHVRVVDDRGEPRFLEEHLHESPLVGQRRQDAFEDDPAREAADALLTGEVDLGHTSLGEGFDDLVLADPSPLGLGHGKRRNHATAALRATMRSGRRGEGQRLQNRCDFEAVSCPAPPVVPEDSPLAGVAGGDDGAGEAGPIARFAEVGDLLEGVVELPAATDAPEAALLTLWAVSTAGEGHLVEKVREVRSAGVVDPDDVDGDAHLLGGNSRRVLTGR